MTPMDSGDARETALELERFRAALLSRWKRPEAATRRLRVVVYPDMAEFKEHQADKFEGFARDDGLIVEAHPGFTQEGLGLAKTITHELAHQIDASVLLRQPRWLNEGLAQYLSTVTIEDGKARFGRASYEHLMNARYLKPLSLDELWGWDEKDPPSMSREELNRYYVEAWLWVTYLDNERGDRFDDFLARLARAEPPRAAFQAAFAGLSEDQLQHEIREFLTRIFPTNAVALPPVDRRSPNRR
jgi:hypothetical protein